MIKITGNIAVTLLLGCFFAWQAAAVTELSGWEPAIMTHYGGAQDKMDPSSRSFGSKEGACGYGEIPKDAWPYFSVAALSPKNKFYQAGPVNGCGKCFQIQCVSHINPGDHPGACKTDGNGKPKSILVQITDECPECGADHIDVQSLAFDKLMDAGLGRMNIQYRRVECTPPEDMKISVMDFVGSNGWLRLSIDDTGGRGAVSAVHVKGSGSGAWIAMKNTWGAAWELSSAPAPPLDFKLTTDDGEEVAATDVIRQNGGISVGAFGDQVKFTTGVQFTISNPDLLVQAASGPSDDFDPMVVTSASSGPALTASAGALSSSDETSNSSEARTDNGASSTSSTCADVTPPGQYSCQQQKGWGKCQEQFLVQNSYCASTCGRCGSNDGGSSGSDTVQSFSGPADGSGNRKLLARAATP